MKVTGFSIMVETEPLPFVSLYQLQKRKTDEIYNEKITNAKLLALRRPT